MENRKGASAPDFLLANHGSVLFLHPQNKNAEAWVDEHIGPDNGYQPQYPSVLMEPRYVEAILMGLQSDGLTVRLA